jgi:two-component system response regulator PilR (NtrC family)
MPELDGWKVLEAIKQTQPTPRVIIITARGKEDTGRIAQERGAWAYVEKPYFIDKIKEMLKKFFNEESKTNSGLNFSPV